MRTPESSLPIFIFGSLVCCALAVGIYVGGYFTLSEATIVHDPGQNPPFRLRVFRRAWLADMYEPMTDLEEWLTGTHTFAETGEAL
jgi:hypothetical protein